MKTVNQPVRKKDAMQLVTGHKRSDLSHFFIFII